MCLRQKSGNCFKIPYPYPTQNQFFVKWLVLYVKALANLGTQPMTTLIDGDIDEGLPSFLNIEARIRMKIHAMFQSAKRSGHDQFCTHEIDGFEWELVQGQAKPEMSNYSSRSSYQKNSS